MEQIEGKFMNPCKRSLRGGMRVHYTVQRNKLQVPLLVLLRIFQFRFGCRAAESDNQVALQDAKETQEFNNLKSFTARAGWTIPQEKQRAGQRRTTDYCY